MVKRHVALLSLKGICLAVGDNFIGRSLAVGESVIGRDLVVYDSHR